MESTWLCHLNCDYFSTHLPFARGMRFLEHKRKGIIAQETDAILNTAVELIAAGPGDSGAGRVAGAIFGTLYDVDIVVKDLPHNKSEKNSIR